MTNNSVIVKGKSFVDVTTRLYEKTTNDQEVVKYRILSKGTADHQAKLFVSGTIPQAIALTQTSYTPIVSDKPDSTYAQDTKPIDIGTLESQAIYRVTLDDGQSITKNQILMAEAGTGKAQLWDGTELPFGRAKETVAASGADGYIRFAPYFGQSERKISETIAIASNTGVTTYAPISRIETVEAVTATNTGALLITQSLAPKSLEVKANYTTGIMTCSATDQVSNLLLTYWYTPTA